MKSFITQHTKLFLALSLALSPVAYAQSNDGYNVIREKSANVQVANQAYFYELYYNDNNQNLLLHLQPKDTQQQSIVIDLLNSKESNYDALTSLDGYTKINFVSAENSGLFIVKEGS